MDCRGRSRNIQSKALLLDWLNCRPCLQVSVVFFSVPFGEASSRSPDVFYNNQLRFSTLTSRPISWIKCREEVRSIPIAILSGLSFVCVAPSFDSSVRLRISTSHSGVAPMTLRAREESPRLVRRLALRHSGEQSDSLLSHVFVSCSWIFFIFLAPQW